MIQPILSPVAPRVCSPCTGATLQLVDEIELLIERGDSIRAHIVGEASSEALSHVAAAMQTYINVGQLRIDGEAHSSENDPVVTLTASDRRSDTTLAAKESQQHAAVDIVLPLVGWGQDDFIEYLLAKHPEKCSSVIERLADADVSFASGSPSVWKIILDRMASDESKVDIVAIVLAEMHLRISNASFAKALADELIVPSKGESLGVLGHPAKPNGDQNLFFDPRYASVKELFAHDQICFAFALERFLQRLEEAEEHEVELLMRGWMNEARLNKLATHIRDNPTIKANVQSEFDRHFHRTVANCASLLSRCDLEWRPHGEKLLLYHGYFASVKWADIDLSMFDLRHCSFHTADLSFAKLNDAKISQADFSFAKLTRADFSRSSDRWAIRMPNAVPNEPEPVEPSKPKSLLSKLVPKSKKKRVESKRTETKQRLSRICYHRVNFQDADLARADLSGCYFDGASFENANMHSVDALNAIFQNTSFASADLTEADFCNSVFIDVRLQNALLDQGKFVRLRAESLNMTDHSADDVDFSHASLVKSTWTNSTLNRCDFRSANLSQSRLAEVNWENCDFRDADLQGCTFHMGSTRCGIVESPYPSHGTRTGFYTDEYEERYFQNPETIRKANLCGADLRGANLLDVDFYLVDLRGAKFDRIHRNQLISTGAILDEDVY